MGVFVGLDLGQVNDPSALVVLEQATSEEAELPHYYNVRHLERLPLHTKYPAIVEIVQGIMAAPQLLGAMLIVDGTGVGRPVVDMFTAAGMKLIAISITSGGQPHQVDETWWNVPKRDLVSTLQVLLQADRIRFGNRLAAAEAMKEEFKNFQVKITTAANDVYGAWREGTNDDLILGAAIAAWAGDNVALLTSIVNSGVFLPQFFGIARGAARG